MIMSYGPGLTCGEGLSRDTVNYLFIIINHKYSIILTKKVSDIDILKKGKYALTFGTVL